MTGSAPRFGWNYTPGRISKYVTAFKDPGNGMNRLRVRLKSFVPALRDGAFLPERILRGTLPRGALRFPWAIFSSSLREENSLGQLVGRMVHSANLPRDAKTTSPN
jgi:hypothetical protein